MEKLNQVLSVRADSRSNCIGGQPKPVAQSTKPTVVGVTRGNHREALLFAVIVCTGTYLAPGVWRLAPPTAHPGHVHDTQIASPPSPDVDFGTAQWSHVLQRRFPGWGRHVPPSGRAPAAS